MKPCHAFKVACTFLVSLLFCTAVALEHHQAFSQTVPTETYRSASVDATGNLVIITARGETVVVRKEGEQSRFGKPMLSADRTAVGALAEYPNCCTSYDIPLQLTVYSKGKLHRFDGDGLAIFLWDFADAGARVAFGRTTVHSACNTLYELRDIETGRLLETAEVPEPCGQIPDPPAVKPPDWVTALTQKKQ